MIKNSIVILIAYYALSASAQSPCDSKAENKAEAMSEACSAKEQKAVKLWKDIETAKKDIDVFFKKKDFSILFPYIGCDAGDSSHLEIICESDMPKIGAPELNLLLARSKGRDTLGKSKWVTFGVNKDIFILCSSDFNFKAAKNYCDETGNLQPIIEIRKSKAGFYIFGIALSGT